MKNISMSDTELLQFAIENGMIDTTLVQEKIEMQRKEELLNKHPYKIWEGKDGKWYTYLPDEKKGRKLKKRSSQEGIEDLVVLYYKNKEETHYIKDVFNEWINEKLSFGEIQKQTYDRYNTDFHRFFDNQDISKMDMKNISEEDLEFFIKSMISKKNLSNKAYAGMRTIVIGIFKYAKKKKYTNISITQFFGDIDISKKVFKRKTVKDEDSVFTNEEVNKIAKFISEDTTIINLGIMLAFQTGLRAGELSTLKYSDVQGNVLHVNKTEVRYKDNDNKYVFEVRESAKTEAGNREVILGSDALNTIKLIRKLNPIGEYMFVNNGTRIKGKAFTVKLNKICRYLGIKERSIHKARKTYATKLINAHVDERIIIKQLGHTDISCTKNFYYYNNKSIDEAKEQIEKAISY